MQRCYDDDERASVSTVLSSDYHRYVDLRLPSCKECASVVVSDKVLCSVQCARCRGHSAKMSFYSWILYAKFFDCGVSHRGLDAWCMLMRIKGITNGVVFPRLARMCVHFALFF